MIIDIYIYIYIFIYHTDNRLEGVRVYKGIGWGVIDGVRTSSFTTLLKGGEGVNVLLSSSYTYVSYKEQTFKRE